MFIVWQYKNIEYHRMEINTLVEVVISMSYAGGGTWQNMYCTVVLVSAKGRNQKLCIWGQNLTYNFYNNGE